MSESEYDVIIVKDFMVPMRDGVRLATDVYLPARDGEAVEGRFPAILERTPYNKDMIQPTLSNLGMSRCLENGARLALEHSPLEPIPENLPGFKISDQRRYGKTLVSFFIYMV